MWARLCLRCPLEAESVERTLEDLTRQAREETIEFCLSRGYSYRVLTSRVDHEARHVEVSARVWVREALTGSVPVAL